jgi:hypothetical protein
MESDNSAARMSLSNMPLINQEHCNYSVVIGVTELGVTDLSQQREVTRKLQIVSSVVLNRMTYLCM